MKALFNAYQYTQLLVNGSIRETDLTADLKPVVNLVAPDNSNYWLMTAVNPVDGDTLYGVNIATDETIHAGETTIEELVFNMYQPNEKWVAESAKRTSEYLAIKNHIFNLSLPI